MLPAAIALLCCQKAPSEVQAVAARQDLFGLATLQAMAEPGQNIVISPNNLLYAFAGLYPASSGESRRALEKALGVVGVRDGSEAVLQQIFRQPGMADEQLEAAAAAWIDDELRPTPAYVDAVKSGLGYDIRNLDLQGSSALAEINGWVNRETHEKIPVILQEMPRGALMVLTSALYYKAPWVEKMTVYTEPMLFGDKKSKVKQMGMNGEFAQREMPTYKTIVVPFKGDAVAEFYVPKGPNTPEGIAQAALADRGRLALETPRTRLRMPFWHVEYFESVKEPLKQAGLAPLFEPRDEFRPIAPDVWVLDAFHRTWIDMNENGVEAAAATAVVVGRTSAPIGQPVLFDIDRPFFVVVRKRSSGAALFMGFIYEPTRF